MAPAVNLSFGFSFEIHEYLYFYFLKLHGRCGNCVCASFRCYSDEDLSKLGISSPSSIALSPVLAASSPLRAMSPQDGTQRHLNAHDNTTDNESTDFTMVAVLEGIKNHRRMFRKQMDEVIELKVCVESLLLDY